MQPTPTGGRLWCIGDRVMMTANNYKINIMNGDQGKVVALEDAGVKVEFDDGIQHLFKFQNSDEVDKDGNPIDPEDIEEDSSDDKLYTDYIVHSYGQSIHKSQGSEYDFVVLYIPEDKSFSNFLNINLLYTAITRTKKSIWLVASKDTLERTSMTVQPSRFDGLSDMLRAMKNVSSEDVLKTMIVKPELETELKSSTALTAVHEDYDREYE
jgi:exodeoxyribonuclease V alpha subunit